MDEGMISAIFGLAWYVLQVIGDWKLFKKAGKKGWHSIMPILNIYDEYELCWKGSKGILQHKLASLKLAEKNDVLY